MKQVIEEFPKLDLQVEFFDAIWHKKGHKGCILSHIACLKQADGFPFMVLEDDVKIIGKKKHLEKAIEQLPEDWDILYLGATLTKKLKKYSPNLYRLTGGLTTHAIIYNSQRVVDYIINNAESGKQIDTFMMKVQDKFRCFITYPMIMTQQPGFSDTCNQFTDYEIIQRSYKKHTNGCNENN
jgi:GR25 family glycosyltransferase involved in LPS biosynthesis